MEEGPRPVLLVSKPRPDEEPASLRWDIELGRKYKALLDDEAFQHFAGQLYSFRDAMLDRLVRGTEEDVENMAEARASVKLIDALLSVPDAMIREGKFSAEEIQHYADDEEEVNDG